MKKILVSGLFASMTAACASQPPPPPPPPPAAPVAKATTPEDILEEANALFAKRDYEGALASYDRLLQLKADDEVGQFNRAVTLHRLGRKDQAKQVYESILAKNEGDVAAALNLGAILKDEGQLDQAIALYKKVLKQDEYNADLLNNLSVLQRKKKEYKGAVATIRKLLMRDKDNVDAYKNLALIHYDQKQYKLSQTILENALKMATEQKKEDPDIYVNLGMVFLASKENGKAMAAFKKAIGLDPMHVVANYNIGALALGHRDYNLAAKAYEVVAKAWPDRYDVHASLGLAYQGLEQFDKAAAELTAARKIKLEKGEALAQAEEENLTRQTVNVLQNAGKAKDALKMLNDYLLEKGINCGPDQIEGVCGQKLGLEATIQLETQQQQVPEEKKEAKDANQSNIFTDQPVEGTEEGAPPAEGGAPPAEGAAPPAEGEAPAEPATPQ
jgi:tetratricopeptide (TPR) repeat protein